MAIDEEEVQASLVNDAAPLEPLEAVAPDAIVVRAADSDALIDLVATIDREAVLIVECSAKGPRDPLVVSVLGAAFREIMGATNPANAAPGTIRADFATSVEANAVHGSDAPETAAQEIAFFFGEMDIHAR